MRHLGLKIAKPLGRGELNEFEAAAMAAGFQDLSAPDQAAVRWAQATLMAKGTPGLGEAGTLELLMKLGIWHAHRHGE